MVKVDFVYIWRGKYRHVNFVVYLVKLTTSRKIMERRGEANGNDICVCDKNARP